MTIVHRSLQVPARQWSRIQLFRYLDGSERQFRLIIAGGDEGKAAAESASRSSPPAEKGPRNAILTTNNCDQHVSLTLISRPLVSRLAMLAAAAESRSR